MLTFMERRAELQQKVGYLETIPTPPIQLRTLIIRFWFEALGNIDQFRNNKKVVLFCETLIKKLNIMPQDGQDAVDNLCAHFCSEPDAEKVLTLIEYSFWVLGIIEQQQIKPVVTKLNLALQTYDIPYEYVNGEMLYRKR
ncbi:MAG: hypothetical protein F6K00_15170 [Leptolyngbya sp. SIOISBB]|nr:hypothetical protein [Leptolyngbya sp. SIOISBB]